MADYAANNTRRLRVLYTGPRGTHLMLFRNDGQTQTMAQLITAARDCAANMALLQWVGTSWVSAEGAEEGSDVFLPVVWGAAVNSVVGSAAPTNTDPYGFYLQFPGRSTAGSRVAFYLYNAFNSLSTANNRLTPAESAAAGNTITLLNTGVLRAVDGNPFVMKAYANTGYNDHLVRTSRRAA